MAAILTDTITIRLSKLVRNTAKGETIADANFKAGLEAVVAEMLGDEAIIVEIEDADVENLD